MACPYLVLLVSHDATDDDIKLAYRECIRETHPDRAGVQSTQQAQLITWANRMIGGQDARAAFDRGAGVCDACCADGVPQQVAHAMQRRRADQIHRRTAAQKGPGARGPGSTTAPTLPPSLMYPPISMNLSLDDYEIQGRVTIVAVGPESAGKSTLLNRIAGAPLLEVARRRCTRTVLELRMRTARHGAVAAVVRVPFNATEADVDAAIRAETASDLASAAPLYETAARIRQLTSQLTETNSFDQQHRIVIAIEHDALPNVSLIDTPGITVDAHGATTNSIATNAVFRARANADKTPVLVLLFHNTTSTSSMNPVLGLSQIVQYTVPRSERPTVAVVFTKCDVLESDDVEAERALSLEQQREVLVQVAEQRKCAVDDVAFFRAASRIIAPARADAAAAAVAAGGDAWTDYDNYAAMHEFEQKELGRHHGTQGLLQLVAAMLADGTPDPAAASVAAASAADLAAVFANVDPQLLSNIHRQTLAIDAEVHNGTVSYYLYTHVNGEYRIRDDVLRGDFRAVEDSIRAYFARYIAIVIDAVRQHVIDATKRKLDDWMRQQTASDPAVARAIEREREAILRAINEVVERVLERAGPQRVAQLCDDLAHVDADEIGLPPIISSVAYNAPLHYALGRALIDSNKLRRHVIDAAVLAPLGVLASERVWQPVQDGIVAREQDRVTTLRHLHAWRDAMYAL